LEDREDKLDAVYDEIERDLELLGATAIEDKLQVSQKSLTRVFSALLDKRGKRMNVKKDSKEVEVVREQKTVDDDEGDVV